MQLERIEISGFRGIQRMSLSFDELTTLVGENTWGKSSLLDALSIALPTDGQVYQFVMQDFHVDYSVSQPQTQHLQILLSWRSSFDGEEKAGRYRRIKPVWTEDQEGTKRIIYRLSATREEYKITTHCTFLDQAGTPLRLHHCEKFAQELMALHPVIRLRDARRQKRNGNDNSSDLRIEKRIANTSRRLLAAPGHVNKGEMRSSLNSMENLVDHYFNVNGQSRSNPRRARDRIFFGNTNSDKNALSQMAGKSNNKQTRLLLMGLLSAYLQAKGPTNLRRCARPILIIEDPEGRLHPTHLIRAWSIFQLLPMQKIITTNSGDLLSAVPLSSIRRLSRMSNKTVAYSLPAKRFGEDELRRIGFHIRFHRSSALFARCWLLVEGETEVWLFNELAKLCDYNLAAEGVQIVEFAQSGLKSLIKVAQSFAIEWHVVTDGDPAGKKYAHAVRNLLNGEHERHRLTELPDKDIEHFLYQHGLEHFFKNLVKIPADHPIPAKKVINRALKKYAKPDLALAIVSHLELQKPEDIPVLIRWTIKRVVNMANGNT
ncbi:ATP-dependent endonuclease [Vibrio sp. SCSIO 43136]|uniref:ATP-dependent endonuclease n=1 Tax=Vibrio sp. SCSIO 43136 TaxID=2819101 RepID=UPI00207666F2|nr:ATP-dependent endonuclease [Vibrio sp. SCSIO 43136]USD66749.1 ATP-dependent endonuclease [Vibrio sp. SCSIO 43136]